jgi:hypothetical protein
MTEFQLKRAFELAWAAGLIDGEGCIGIFEDSNYLKAYLRLSLNMTHQETVKRFHKLFGAGTVRLATKQNSNWRQQLSYKASGKDALFVIKELLPYLFTKRESALLAVSFMEFYLPICGGKGYKLLAPTQEQLIKAKTFVVRSSELNARGVRAPV